MKLANNMLFIIFLSFIFAHNIHTMKRPIENEPSQPISFNDLPPEILYQIVLNISKTAQSVQEAGKAINDFLQTNKELTVLINNPTICLQIIKNLSQHFKCSDQKAAEALQTEEAKDRLNIQKKFVYVCLQENLNDEDFDLFYKQYENYIDLDFVFSFDRDEEDSDGVERTILMLAAITNDCNLITKLLKLGADINKVNSEGMSALIIAVYYGHIDATECLLINPKIAINQQTQTGWTALLFSIGSDDSTLIQMFLDHEANINQASFDGVTPLTMAVSNNCINAVKCLLGNPNIAIDQQGHMGQTALITAIQRKNKPIIKLLLKANANPEIADNDGLTPLQAAEKTDDQEIIDLIQDAINKKYEKNKG